jgi:hypothetical protein
VCGDPPIHRGATPRPIGSLALLKSSERPELPRVGESRRGGSAYSLLSNTLRYQLTNLSFNRIIEPLIQQGR